MEKCCVCLKVQKLNSCISFGQALVSNGLFYLHVHGTKIYYNRFPDSLKWWFLCRYQISSAITRESQFRRVVAIFYTVTVRFQIRLHLAWVGLHNFTLFWSHTANIWRTVPMKTRHKQFISTIQWHLTSSPYDHKNYWNESYVIISHGTVPKHVTSLGCSLVRFPPMP